MTGEWGTLIAGACTVPLSMPLPLLPCQPQHSLFNAVAAVRFDCWRVCCCALQMPLRPLPPVCTNPPKSRRSTHCLSPLLLGTLMYCQVKAVG